MFSAVMLTCECQTVGWTSGNAYRFTMQPEVASIKRQFRCHIRHVSPTVLYRLFYYVQVPATSTATTSSGVTSALRRPRFQTTKIHRTVASRPGDVEYSQRGRYDVDFLTADHNTGLRVLDDFILTAVRASAVDDKDADRWNYSVRPSTVRTAPASQTASFHTVSENVFVAAVQPQTPFVYRYQVSHTLQHCRCQCQFV